MLIDKLLIHKTMAIIVKRKTTDETFVLLGTGFGKCQSEKPNWLYGNIIPDTDAGEVQIICACNADGDVFWLEAKSVQVISVDGKKPKAYLEE